MLFRVFCNEIMVGTNQEVSSYWVVVIALRGFFWNTDGE